MNARQTGFLHGYMCKEAVDNIPGKLPDPPAAVPPGPSGQERLLQILSKGNSLAGTAAKAADAFTAPRGPLDSRLGQVRQNAGVVQTDLQNADTIAETGKSAVRQTGETLTQGGRPGERYLEEGARIFGNAGQAANQVQKNVATIRGQAEQALAGKRVMPVAR